MSFIWPWMLLLLLFIPVLVLVYILMQRRRQKYALRYASLSLVKEALGRGPGIRRHIPAVLFLLALTAMIIALARPQATVLAPSQAGTVILAIDVSGSMIATDLAPNRLEAAKAAARSFVEKQPDTVQVGVVSFSDNAFVVQPPTNNRDLLIAAINRLQYQRGTAIGRGLLTSMQVIDELNGAPPPSDNFLSGEATATPTPEPTPYPKGQFAPAVIVLLTDGENNQWPDPLDIAPQVANHGIRVYTVGIGSAEGSVVRIQGRAIRTRLDEDTLRSIADTTSGQYYNASNEADLKSIYENLSTQLILKTEKTEVTAYVTGVAVILALAAGMLSLIWFSRLP